MIASEVAPLIKVGGLADVVGALSKELAGMGHEVRLVCPLYSGIKKIGKWIPYNIPLTVNLGRENLQCRIWESRLPGSEVETYFLEFNEFYDRPDVYGNSSRGPQDNDRRFIFLSRAALNLCYYLGWIPDVIHCHDWPTALVPVYLNANDFYEPLGKAASILTIHNLQHQGHFPYSSIEYAQLPASVYRPDCLEAMGHVNFLKGGIYNATKITTVSPEYAREILKPDNGHGLHHILKLRAGDLIGEINGIDTSVWNPQSDPLLPATYSISNRKGKGLCKAELQKELGLEIKAEIPLFGVVSRLYQQKGLDLLAEAVAAIMETTDGQIALLGTGEKELEERFKQLGERFKGRVGVQIGFSDQLAHLIYGGSDFFVMPSRFEPCGLSQMYAMRYGTPPVARSTGGLIDTIDPYGNGKRDATGLLFADATPEDLGSAIERAAILYRDQPKEYRRLQLNGMRKDFSWKNPSATYENIYRWAVETRKQAG